MVRSSRVSRKSRSKVNRKMNRSRKVSRRVNKSRKVSRRRTKRVNKSRRISRKRTKRVNNSRRVSRKRTKRVNNKRTKRTRRISRKRTREIEGGVIDWLRRKSPREISSPVLTDSPPASPLSESGLSERDQKLEVNGIIERYGQTNKSNENLKIAIAEFKGLNITDEESIARFRKEVMQPAITKMKEEIENGELTFEQALIDFLSLEIDERTASSKDFMDYIKAKQVKKEMNKIMGLSNPQITPTEASELRTKTDDFLESIKIKLPNEHDTTRKKLEKLLSDAKKSVGRGHTENYEQAKKLLFGRVIQPLIDFIKSIATKFDATLDESNYAGKSYSELLTDAQNLITNESEKKEKELELELVEVISHKKGAEKTLEEKTAEMKETQIEIEIEKKKKPTRKLQKELERNLLIVEMVENAKKVVVGLESEKRSIKSKQKSLELKVQQLNKELERKKNNELLPLFNGIDTLVTDYERLEAKAAEAQAAAKEEFEGQRRLIAEKQAKAAAEKEREENRKKRRKEREAAAEEEKERKRLEAERLKAERLEAEASAAEAAASAAEAAAAAAAASKKEEKERLQAAAAAETEETERFIANKKEERERKVRSAEIAQKFKDLLNSNSYNADTDKPEYLSDFGPEWELYHSVLEDSENSTLKSDLNTFFVKAEDLKSEGISDYDLLVYLINEHKLLEEESLIGLDGGIPSTKDFSSWPDMGLDRSRAKNMIKKLLILELLHMTPELEFLREIFRINFDD